MHVKYFRETFNSILYLCCKKYYFYFWTFNKICCICKSLIWMCICMCACMWKSRKKPQFFISVDVVLNRDTWFGLVCQEWIYIHGLFKNSDKFIMISVQYNWKCSVIKGHFLLNFKLQVVGYFWSVTLYPTEYSAY